MVVRRGIGGGQTLRLARKSDALKYWNRAENVEAMIAMLAANRLQQEQRKHSFLKETARARTVRLPSAAFPTVKFAKEPFPQLGCKRRHDIPPAARASILNPGDARMGAVTHQQLRGSSPYKRCGASASVMRQ